MKKASAETRHEGEKETPGTSVKATERATQPAPAKAAKLPRTPAKPKPNDPAKPVLLSGGNPQIAKGYGDAPVQAFIAAMPDWKSDIGRRLDALIEATVPGVQKAVKWNTPFYGMDGQHWFLGFHCIAKYVKVAFLEGTSLHPLPPVDSKTKNARYLHIYEDGRFDEVQFADWVKQASKLPGERL